MGIGRLFLSVVLPPLAVTDKGCAVTFAVFLLWVSGWFPGVIVALLINIFAPPRPRYVTIPNAAADSDYPQKRKREFMRLADGELGEIIEDDGEMPRKTKRDEDSAL
jgi:uncharacterized membrane protein YqaE (UPF0057 family)